jgi:carboxyl-terminal processing protease
MPLYVFGRDFTMATTKLTRSFMLVLAALGSGLMFVSSSFAQSTGHTSQMSPDYYKELRRFHHVMVVVQRNYVKEVTEKALVDGAILGMLRGVHLERSLLPPEVFAAPASGGARDEYYDLKRFVSALRTVEKQLSSRVSEKQLVDYACDGMLRSVDPYSSYLTESMFNEMKTQSDVDFGSFGLEMTLVNGVLTVVSPIGDSPAFKAGLRSGDKIIKINGESTRNITLLTAVKLMRGRVGTMGTLTIIRDGWRTSKDFTLTRETIHVQSVTKALMAPRYGYVRIVNFQEGTSADLEKAIDELGGDHGLKGLICDLRNNPGGLLDQAVKVSQLFVDKGLILYTDGGAKDSRIEYKANSLGKHYSFKLAILLNEKSAAASEMVAGALQDHDRAVIFGTGRSLGRGSIQTVIPLEDGSAVRLSTACWYTPKGRHIEKTGIVPDASLSLIMSQRQDPQQVLMFGKKRDSDVVLRTALEWLNSDVTVQQCKSRKMTVFPSVLPAANADSQRTVGRFLKERAQRGDREALYCLGLLYMDNPEVQYRLGLMYRDGSGLPKDRRKANKWFTKAADQGHEGAKKELGK